MITQKAMPSAHTNVSSFWSATTQVWQLNRKKRLSRTIKFLLRCSLHPHAILQWMTALRQQPELAPWQVHSPRLLFKPLRHYMNRRYGVAERISLLMQHYTFVWRNFPANWISQLAEGHALTLATLNGKREQRYNIQLCKTDKFDREGELLLSLRNSQTDQLIYACAFSISQQHGVRKIEMGCIQGAKGESATQVIREATKELHGIRPRDFLLQALYCLVDEWSVHSVLGPSNSSRVYQTKATVANYNDYWQEFGAHPTQSGEYRLPIKLVHTDPNDVPSNKRAEYKRREALRQELASQVHHCWLTASQQH